MTAEENTLEQKVRAESLTRSMRIFLLIATLIIIAISISLTLQSKPEITQESLHQEIQTLQQQLPIKVDANTELKSVQLDGMKLKYSFVVADDPTQTEGMSTKDKEFALHVENAVKKNACLNKNTKRYINSNVSLAYLYLDKANTTLANFIIPAGFCKQ